MNRIQSELQRMIDNAKKMGPKSDEKKIADLLEGWLSEPSTPESRTAFAKTILRVLAEYRCDRCDGDGKAHGSDRPFEWSGPGTYPGPCPKCGGTGRSPTSFWLIERFEGGKSRGYLQSNLTPQNHGGWTSLVDNAVMFVRRKDAEGAIDLMGFDRGDGGSHEIRATQHSFIGQ